MKAWAWLMASAFFLAGCVSGPAYYHESSDGTRYYMTRTGALVVVDRTGSVIETPPMYGADYPKTVRKKGADWDLSAYDIGEPPGYCMGVLSPLPESCWNRVWEAPALILMAPVLFLPTPPLIGDPIYIAPPARPRTDMG